jgi:hypothetical protein
MRHACGDVIEKNILAVPQRILHRRDVRGIRDEVLYRVFGARHRRLAASRAHDAFRGTSLESKLYRSDCDVEPRTSLPFSPTMSEAQRVQFADAIERMDSGVDGDALLFLGKADTLTRTPMEPSIYLDLKYRREIERWQRLAFGESLTGSRVEQNPVCHISFIHIEENAA